MIVSGFTQKKVQEEPCYGSSLDHTHCVTCVSRTCKVIGNDVTTCDVMDCPRGCCQRYHCCKENEHALLCAEERVKCINSSYGCPLVMYRRKLAEHLRTCPASIVHCRAEWNRSHLEPVKAGEQHSVLLKKTQGHCGQLDTALAMRDHRVLVDRLLFPAETSPHSPGSLTHIHPPPSMAARATSSSSDLDIPPPVLPDQWGCGIRQKKMEAMLEAKSSVHDSSVQPATSLSLFGCMSDHSDSTIKTETGRVSDRSAEKEGSQEHQVQHGQALRSVLSLSMSVDCIARYQPKPDNTYTFPCAQNIRRDEFRHHFYAVHDRIQSDLSGWMEQRCPLAYLGCPFSFRRFRPSQPNMTLRHSWLLESFGVTSVDPSADFSHQTPSHLLPAFPETAEEVLRESGDQHCVDSPQSKPADQSNAGMKSSSVLSKNGSLKSPSPKEASSTPLSKAELLEKATASSNDPQPAVNDFSSLLNSISLEDGGTSQTLNSQQEQNQTNSTHPANASGQAAKHLSQETWQDSVRNDNLSSVQNQRDKEENNLPPSLSSLPPSLSNLPPSLSPAQHQVPAVPNGPSKTPNTHGAEEIIYTGTGPNSCVRLDSKNSTSDDGRKGTESSSDNSKKGKESSSNIQLADLPSEIVWHVTQFLDSFSLYNLSLVSRSMRDLCCTLLQDRGMVSLVWTKQRLGDQTVWRVVGKSWSFSTSFDAVDSWRFTGHNPIPGHLVTCAYNQDRVARTDKFSIVPISEAPLNIQIRDMLQQLLRRRRDFRGWIIRSNFDRELVSEARPMEGPFADVLTALGGTLPQ